MTKKAKSKKAKGKVRSEQEPMDTNREARKPKKPKAPKY